MPASPKISKSVTTAAPSLNSTPPTAGNSANSKGVECQFVTSSSPPSPPTPSSRRFRDRVKEGLIKSSASVCPISSILESEKVEARRSGAGGAGDRECEEERLWALVWRRGPRERRLEVGSGECALELVVVVKVAARLGGAGAGAGRSAGGSGMVLGFGYEVVVLIASLSCWICSFRCRGLCYVLDLSPLEVLMLRPRDDRATVIGLTIMQEQLTMPLAHDVRRAEV